MGRVTDGNPLLKRDLNGIYSVIERLKNQRAPAIPLNLYFEYSSANFQYIFPG